MLRKVSRREEPAIYMTQDVRGQHRASHMGVM